MRGSSSLWTVPLLDRLPRNQAEQMIGRKPVSSIFFLASSSVPAVLGFCFEYFPVSTDDKLQYRGVSQIMYFTNGFCHYVHVMAIHSHLHLKLLKVICQFYCIFVNKITPYVYCPSLNSVSVIKLPNKNNVAKK